MLALNAGSSSLKFAAFTSQAPQRRVLGGMIARLGLDGTTLTFSTRGSSATSRPVDAPDHTRALDAAIKVLEPHIALSEVVAVGHRIVHGGANHARAALVTPELLAELAPLRAIDPDHMPAELAIVDAMRARMPDLPQVACFDTAFHRTMPRVARLLPIPHRFEAAGVRRYGFHGLSYAFLIEELERVAGAEAARGRVVLAHLGSGASLAAVADRQSVDTTMAFTPTSGIMMGTRTGDLDPGVLLYLLRDEHITLDALDALLNRQSGLLGVSGVSPDMRELLVREATDARARDAVALFCHQAKKAVGALAAVLGGMDTLVFSGGIGERAAPVRARIAAGLEHLGVHIDETRNTASAPVISTDASACTVRVIATDEEAMIARETLSLVSAAPQGESR